MNYWARKKKNLHGVCQGAINSKRGKVDDVYNRDFRDFRSCRHALRVAHQLRCPLRILIDVETVMADERGPRGRAWITVRRLQGTYYATW